MLPPASAVMSRRRACGYSDCPIIRHSGEWSPPKSPAALLPSTDLVADVFKLSLPVWVRCSLDGLAVGLKAVVFRLQQLRHKRVTHLVVQPLEFLDQFAN